MWQLWELKKCSKSAAPGGSANETTSDGTWTYTYDDAGQRTMKTKGVGSETWVYQYDHDGHLTRIEKRNTQAGKPQQQLETK